MSIRPSAMKKAKFQVGQVVCIRRGFMNAGQYGRIESCYPRHHEAGWEYELHPGGRTAVEFALRPLTTREMGPRPKRGRKGKL